jgi:hypothetical protein
MISTMFPGTFAAICFDMDGTLVDSEPTHAVVNRVMLERLGVAHKRIDKDYTGFPDELVYQDMIDPSASSAPPIHADGVSGITALVPSAAGLLPI